MRQLSGRVVEIGVDWITAIGFTGDSQVSMQDFGAKLLLNEGSRGNDVSPWHFAGYDGFRCGSVQVGSREDSTCVRLSSNQANSNWQSLYVMSESVSRVDYQVTVQTDCGPSESIAIAHRQALRSSAKLKHGPSVTLIRSNDGSATLYLGKRTSDWYGRAYLKGIESGLPEFDKTTRFEVEVKGPACASTLRVVHNSRPTIIAVAGYVSGFFQKRGVHLVLPNIHPSTISSSRSRSDNQRRLRWLKTQVRPSIDKLIASGCYDDVVEALGLSGPFGVTRQE